MKIAQHLSRYATLLKWISSSLFFLFIFYSGIYKSWGMIKNDFPNYYVSSQILVQQKSYSILYNDKQFNHEVNNFGIVQDSKFSQYPPLTAVIMIPLTGFDPLTAKNIWTVFNMLVLVSCLFLVKHIFSISFTDTFFIFSLTGYSMINNFAFGQFYLVLLLLILLSVYSAEKGYASTAGFLLGFAAVIKIIPVVIIIWFLISGKRKAAIFSVFSALLFLLIECIIFGTEISSQYWLSILPGHLNSNLILQSPYAFSFQSWNSLLMNLFVYNSQFNPEPLYNSIFLFTFLKFIIYSVIAVLVILNLRLMKNTVTETTADERFQILLIGSLLLLPASATYHFVLLAIPAAIIIKSASYSIEQKSFQFLMIFLIGFIPLNHVNQFHLTGFWTIFHYPRLICLSLLFIPISINFMKEKQFEN